jgi:hypothetical protein
MALGDLDLPTVELVADWIETVLFVSGAATVGLDKLFSLAEQELGFERATVAMALRVMSVRERTLGALYPFEVVENIAVCRRKPCRSEGSYASLLCLTPSSPARQLVPGLSTSEMGYKLEELAESALVNLWGTGGRALRFGFPSVHGRPEKFDQAITWLAAQIGVEPGTGYRPPRRKDGGVDVVAWRQFMDGRPGFPIALAQCTVQAETFTKTTDIDIRLWATWLAMDADPTSLLVIPGTIRREGPEWGQLTSVVTVIERLRLVELLGRSEGTEQASAWTDEVLGRLGGLVVHEI